MHSWKSESQILLVNERNTWINANYCWAQIPELTVNF